MIELANMNVKSSYEYAKYAENIEEKQEHSQGRCF